MMTEQSFAKPDIAHQAKSWLWCVALAVSLVPWLIVAAKFILAAAGAPFDAVEAAISAIFYSILPSIAAWLGLTLLSGFFGGWRRALLALTGALPLGAIYFITTAWLNR